MLRKRVIFGTSYVFPNNDDHFALISSVADHFKVHPANVLIVGSAKLGFSIAPKKRYRYFNDRSDIDVVVVSEQLFDEIWWEIHSTAVRRFDWPQRQDFAKYLMRGWIRPDMFPNINTPRVSNWWNFFTDLSRHVGVRVRGALFRNWNFLESYHGENIQNCALELALEEPPPDRNWSERQP
ncbi:MAG TPA: hypothetical protein VFR37_19420 [Longimicrobium sp.]|nr:hypothetical protein [Longimicrobium sp.]